ncbi:MAG: manganese efflux pump MntP family protein [Oscillospiraceae bacterium]|nr:manganese efflux pump MntP family protein [Oscillospiraceae bacterium]
MSIIELIIMAIGVSMDAFAVAICIGLSIEKIEFRKLATVGLYFGAFQAGMPLIGFTVANFFANYIETYDHWSAFILLGFLGGKMIIGSIKNKDEVCEEIELTAINMLPLSLATSIDALIVGVSLALLKVRIIPAISLIGGTTFTFSMLGVILGSTFGLRFRSKAEIAGGSILILIGLKILLEHTLLSSI